MRWSITIRQKPHAAVPEAIAKAMPVVADLFRLINEAPNEALGDAWQAMLDVRGVYETELAACRSTFDSIAWPVGMPAELRFNCPECHSNLVAQQDPANTGHETMDCRWPVVRPWVFGGGSDSTGAGGSF